MGSAVTKTTEIEVLLRPETAWKQMEIVAQMRHLYTVLETPHTWFNQLNELQDDLPIVTPYSRKITY
jgi:hypothetical protein